MASNGQRDFAGLHFLRIILRNYISERNEADIINRMDNLQRIAYFFSQFRLYLVLDALALVLLILASYKIYEKKISAKKKKILLSVSFALFLIVITFSVGEAYFRFGYDEPDGLEAI